ncbi:hypothetical protein L6452_20626 [Arctium lappa]|uniref:Uncharacterized protein n=1 Tax=Arctium lappa TaxID=4217 RepID=A0ACB9BCR9_ARCLA|nr:hypothetical protein L6452_20626 [Arctium lappa]
MNSINLANVVGLRARSSLNPDLTNGDDEDFRPWRRRLLSSMKMKVLFSFTWSSAVHISIFLMLIAVFVFSCFSLSVEKVHDLLQHHPNLMKEFNEVINHMSDEDGNIEHDGEEISEKGKGKRSATSSRLTLKKGKRKRSRVSKKDKNKVKSLLKLDLSNCESCTPSYRLVPKNVVSLAS